MPLRPLRITIEDGLGEVSQAALAGAVSGAVRAYLNASVDLAAGKIDEETAKQRVMNGTAD